MQALLSSIRSLNRHYQAPTHAGCCPGTGDTKGTRETGPLALVGLTFSKFSLSEGVTFSKGNTPLNDGNSFPRKQRQTISS